MRTSNKTATISAGVAAVIIVCLFMVGCAAAPVVDYKSQFQSQGSNGIKVKLESFDDNRPTQARNILGGVFNGYNMRMGDVHEPQDMIQSFEAALRQDLSNAGYSIVNEGAEIVIYTNINMVTCDYSMRTGANMNWTFRVTDKNVEVLNQQYDSEGKNAWSMDQSCGEHLNKALRQMIKSFITDLNEYAKS